MIYRSMTSTNSKTLSASSINTVRAPHPAVMTILFYGTTAHHYIFTGPVQKPEDWKREQKVHAASFLAPTPASVQQKSDDDGSLAAAC